MTQKRLLIQIPSAPNGNYSNELAWWLVSVQTQSLLLDFADAMCESSQNVAERMMIRQAAKKACVAWAYEQASLQWIDPEKVRDLNKLFVPDGWSIAMSPVFGAPISANRNEQARRFLFRRDFVREKEEKTADTILTPTDFDAVLFLDTDNVPGRHDLHVLCDAILRDDVDVVGGVYCMEAPDGPKPLVYKVSDDYKGFEYDTETLLKPIGLQELKGGGLPGGCLLVKRHVFERMWEARRTWFKDRLHDGSFEHHEIHGLLKKHEKAPAELHAALKEMLDKRGDDWLLTNIGSWHIGEDIWFPVVPDTPVLGADWRWRPISDYDVGDQVVGFDESSPANSSRRFQRATVHGVVRRILPRVRIVTDEVEITTTEEHPWLAKLDVKHADKAAWRWTPAGRLAPGMTVASVVTPSDNPDIGSAEYAAGYAQGLLHSDGTRDWRREAPHFVVRMKDTEPLERFATSLSILGIESTRGAARWDGHPKHAPLHRVGVYKDRFGVKLNQIWNMESMPSRAFACGYLAGMFDGDGSYGGGILRIYNQDPVLRARVVEAGRVIGLTLSERDDGAYLYGQGNAFGFFQRTLPSLLRRTAPVGQRGNSGGLTGQEVLHRPVTIRAVERIGVGDVMCLGTSSGTFVADGLASHNCRMCIEMGFRMWVDTRVFVKHLKLADNKQTFLRQQRIGRNWFHMGVEAVEPGKTEEEKDTIYRGFAERRAKAARAKTKEAV